MLYLTTYSDQEFISEEALRFPLPNDESRELSSIEAQEICARLGWYYKTSQAYFLENTGPDITPLDEDGEDGEDGEFIPVSEESATPRRSYRSRTVPTPVNPANMESAPQTPFNLGPTAWEAIDFDLMSPSPSQELFGMDMARQAQVYGMSQGMWDWPAIAPGESRRDEPISLSDQPAAGQSQSPTRYTSEPPPSISRPQRPGSRLPASPRRAPGESD